jgi:hypothetical protein
MQRLTLIRTYIFRSIALVLLAVTTWVVVTPEPNVYSVDKTFIKSHSPGAESTMLALTAADREDLDEEGSIDIQDSPAISSCPTSFISFVRYSKAKVIPFTKMNSGQTYLLHRQLLI